MFRTWYLTAPSDVLRRDAIWARVRPCRIQCRTRHSAGVSTSSCRGLPRRRLTMGEKVVLRHRLFPTPSIPQPARNRAVRGGPYRRAPPVTSGGRRGVDGADPGAVEEHLCRGQRGRVRQEVAVDGG